MLIYIYIILIHTIYYMDIAEDLPPRKINIAPEKGPKRENVIFQASIFRGYVSFKGELLYENRVVLWFLRNSKKCQNHQS